MHLAHLPHLTNSVKGNPTSITYTQTKHLKFLPQETNSTNIAHLDCLQSSIHTDCRILPKTLHPVPTRTWVTFTIPYPHTIHSLHHSRTKTTENNTNPYQYQHTNSKKSPKKHTLMTSNQTLHIGKHTTNLRSTPYPPNQNLNKTQHSFIASPKTLKIYSPCKNVQTRSHIQRHLRTYAKRDGQP
jgi:hypothetical protein